MFLNCSSKCCANISNHYHALYMIPRFFPRYERAQVAAACTLCVRVHCAVRLPVKKDKLIEYQQDIDALLDLAVTICTPSTPSRCRSIKFHWPRHWSQTRAELGCSALEKSLERKLGESHKKNFVYTNKQKGQKDIQMDIADNRLNQLHDLLHSVNAPPMTEGATKGVVMQPRTTPQPPALVAKTKTFYVRGNSKQLPISMGTKARRIAMAKVHQSPYLQEHHPHTIGGQLTMTLRNRQLKKKNPRHLVKVTFRAVPQLYGQPRYDNVKVKLGDTNNVMHMYFARYCNSATKMLPQMFSKMYFIITFHGTFFNYTCATGASLFSKTTMATISHYYGGTQK